MSKDPSLIYIEVGSTLTQIDVKSCESNPKCSSVPESTDSILIF